MKFIRSIFAIIAVVAAGWWITTWNSGPSTPAPSAAEVKLAHEKMQADSLCMASIRNAAHLRQSVKFVHHSNELDPVVQAPGGGFYVAWNITARNKLGMTMPYKAECVVVKGKLASLKISPR